MNIDNEFIKLFKQILGKNEDEIDIFDKIRKNQPQTVFDLLKNLRLKKMNFNDIGDDQFVGIKIPVDFEYEIDTEIGSAKFKENTDNFKINNQKYFEYDDEDYIFSMKCKIWKQYLYDPYINRVIDHVKMLLNKDILNKCDYIYLVGGYSMTPYYHKRLKQEFGLNSQYKIKVIIPPKPILSVVDGAARLSLFMNQERQYVKMRVLGKTYGQIVNKRLTDDLKSKYSFDYLLKNTIIINGITYLRNVFHVYKRKGDTINIGETIKFNIQRMTKTSDGRTDIYYSNIENPLTINDGNCLGYCDVYWDKNDNTLQVINEITFGECIEIVSYPINNPSKKVKAIINYQWK